MIRLSLAFATALAVSGCVTAGGQTEQALKDDLSGNGFVAQLHVSASADAGISADFAAALQETLSDALDDCAVGTRPLRLDVTLRDIKRPNPLRSALITDTNGVQADVIIYDLNTTDIAGRYDITRETRGGLGAGGAIAMTVMSGGQIRNGFAEEVCVRVFGAEPTSMLRTDETSERR